MVADGGRMIVGIINRYLGGALFHETDRNNLPSIQTHGLLSRREAASRDVVAVNPGGNALTMSLDDEAGLADAVFLRFLRGGLMPKRDRSLQRSRVMLRIDPEILLMPGVKIALGFARRFGTPLLSVDRACVEMDWQAVEWALGMESYDTSDLSMTARVRKVFDYEVVIATRVPPEAIIGID